MDLGIRGKVAMVAAGSKGLGRAAALALAGEGCAVSICGRGTEALAATRAELEALGVAAFAAPVDVARADDLLRWHQATEAALGPVAILITNTGGPKAATFGNLSDEDWAVGVASTLMNVVRMTRLVLPGMQARQWGRIVHITSLVAKNHGVKKTIALVENIDYIHLSQSIGVDTLINKKLIAANFIFRYIRKGEVLSLTSLHGADVEVLEFEVTANSKAVGQSIASLPFPKSSVVGGVIRHEKGFIPDANFILQERDHVVILSKMQCIHKVESFFN